VLASSTATSGEIYHALYADLEAEFVGWCVRRTRTIARHLDGDDLAQATWLKVWRRLPGFVRYDEGSGTAAGRLRTWVYRIAQNYLNDIARHHLALPVQTLDSTTAHRVRDTEPDFAGQVADRDEAHYLAAQVSPVLGPSHLDVLRLVAAGMSRHEVAAVLGISIHAVKCRLMRARQTAYKVLGVTGHCVAKPPRHR